MLYQMQFRPFVGVRDPGDVAEQSEGQERGAGSTATSGRLKCWRRLGLWSAVAAALDRIGVPHPGRFTDEFTFRRCPRCDERNLVREDDFTCAICEAELPATWNFGSAEQGER
jgi:hypothetical protein